LILWLFVIGLVGTGIWYGTRLESVTISQVSIYGGETVNHESIVERVRSEIDGTYLLLIPKQFSYLYPQKAIQESVQSVPRVENVLVSRTSRKEISVTFTEYVPYALWCAEESEEAQRCAFISRSGFVFSDAPLIRGSMFLRHNLEGQVPMIGETFQDAAYVRGSEEFKDVLKREHNFTIDVAVLGAEGDVHYQLQKGGEIIISRDADIQEVYENLSSLLTSEEFTHLREGNFSYIDMRFGNEVFVNENINDVEGNPVEVEGEENLESTEEVTEEVEVE